jgi:hypothetical protein
MSHAAPINGGEHTHSHDVVFNIMFNIEEEEDKTSSSSHFIPSHGFSALAARAAASSAAARSTAACVSIFLATSLAGMASGSKACSQCLPVYDGLPSDESMGHKQILSLCRQ